MGFSHVLRHGSQAALAEAAQNRSQKHWLDFSSTRASVFSGKNEGWGAQLLCPEARQEQRSPQSSQHSSFHLPPFSCSSLVSLPPLSPHVPVPQPQAFHRRNLPEETEGSKEQVKTGTFAAHMCSVQRGGLRRGCSARCPHLRAHWMGTGALPTVPALPSLLLRALPALLGSVEPQTSAQACVGRLHTQQPLCLPPGSRPAAPKLF